MNHDIELVPIPGFELGVMEGNDGEFYPIIRFKACDTSEQAEAVIHRLAPVFADILDGNFQRVQ